MTVAAAGPAPNARTASTDKVEINHLRRESGNAQPAMAPPFSCRRYVDRSILTCRGGNAKIAALAGQAGPRLVRFREDGGRRYRTAFRFPSQSLRFAGRVEAAGIE